MTARHSHIGALLAAALLVTACATSPHGITQVATIDALLAGVYEGHMSLAQLRGYGDFGIGTFDHLDGELILLDGRFYKARADGHIYRPALSERTPFASVTKFVPDLRHAVESLDLKGLEARIDSLVPQTNRFCAFMLRGTFHEVRVRSVPAQMKPYRPLVEVTATQPVFTLKDVRGTLIGFRSPPFVKGVNVPGYHMHFLTEDRTAGGHVLSFDLPRGDLAMDTVNEWLHVYLPSESAAFGATDLSRDRSADLEAAEK